MSVHLSDITREVIKLTYHPELGGWQKVLQAGRPGGRTAVEDDAPSSSTNTAEGKTCTQNQTTFYQQRQNLELYQLCGSITLNAFCRNLFLNVHYVNFAPGTETFKMIGAVCCFCFTAGKPLTVGTLSAF